MKIFTKFGRLLLPLTFIFLLLFLSCQKNPNSPVDDKSTISGTIVDEQSNPVPNAVIDVYSTTTAVTTELAKDTTDEDGKFMLSKLPSDYSNLKVTITHPDFKLYDGNLTDFKTKSSAPILLRHDDTCKGALHLYTYNKADSTKLSDVEVRLFRSGSLIRKAFTKDGELFFTNVCPGTYILRLYKPGFQLIYDSTTVAGDDTIPYPLHYYLNETDTCCHGKIAVTVKDSASGNNLDGVNVIVWGGSTQYGNKNTDNNSYVLFTDICTGDYTIRMQKDGYNLKYVNIHMNCNDSNISVQFLTKKTVPDTCCTAVIVASVIDSSNSTPIEGATVYIFKTGGQTIQGTTGSDGKFTASNLCAPASYTVKAMKDGYSFKYVPVTFTSCTTQTVEVALTKIPVDTCCHGKVELTVKDSANGDNLSGVSVKLIYGSTKTDTATTDGNGYALFSELCTGDYTLRMQKSGYNLMYVKIHLNCNDTYTTTQYLSKPDTCCSAVISTTVVDSADSSPIVGATVYIFKTGGQTIQGTTDNNGNFTASNLCAPASYTVKAMKDGYSFKYVPVTFTKCVTQDVKIELVKK
jgi:hypothetical protein